MNQDFINQIIILLLKIDYFIILLIMELLKKTISPQYYEKNYDFLAKIVIIGNSSVGKTNILLRFVDQNYSNNYVPTIGIDFRSKIISVTIKESGKSVKLKLQLWDTAGQQKFMALTNTYFKGASGVIIVYSISDRQSFQSVRDWIIQLDYNSSGHLPKILVGNKCDLYEQRAVSSEQGKMLADSYGCAFIQVSAKQDININQVFSELSRTIFNRINFSQNQKNKLDLTPQSKLALPILTNNNKPNFCCT